MSWTKPDGISRTGLYLLGRTDDDLIPRGFVYLHPKSEGRKAFVERSRLKAEGLDVETLSFEEIRTWDEECRFHPIESMDEAK